MSNARACETTAGLLSTPELIDAEFHGIGIDVLASKDDKIALVYDPDGGAYDVAKRSGLIHRAKEIRSEFLAYLKARGRTLYV